MGRSLQLCIKGEIADKFMREYRGVWLHKKRGLKAAIKEEEEKKKRPTPPPASIVLEHGADEYEKPGADGWGLGRRKTLARGIEVSKRRISG